MNHMNDMCVFLLASSKQNHNAISGNLSGRTMYGTGIRAHMLDRFVSESNLWVETAARADGTFLWGVRTNNRSPHISS